MSRKRLLCLMVCALCPPLLAACGPGPCASEDRSNGKKDGPETDVDCGGGCTKCGVDKLCNNHGDCAKGLYCPGNADSVEKRCRPIPECSDGKRGGDESDVDCGGASCPRCKAGHTCNTSRDCDTKLVCEVGKCVNPKCSNGQQDQDETDVDCGGESGCAPCDLGKSCSNPEDCTTSQCGCQKDASGTIVCDVCTLCTSGVQDGDETGIDCGGQYCPSCSQVSTCEQKSNCHDCLAAPGCGFCADTNGGCTAGVCIGPTSGACSYQNWKFLVNGGDNCGSTSRNACQ